MKALALASLFLLTLARLQPAYAVEAPLGAYMIVCEDDSTVFYLKGRIAYFDSKALNYVDDGNDAMFTYKNGNLSVSAPFNITSEPGQVIIHDGSTKVHPKCQQWGIVN